MNQIVPQAKTQLPAHLQALAASTAITAANAAASAGIMAGGWPRISIKGSRFRLQTPQGDEQVVEAMHLDVIVVDANPFGLSKVYFKGAYDPSVENAAPDCYSDNGVGPSNRSKEPQSGTCASCPHNVWGSKILPSGAKSRVCSDYKKLAVLIADNPDGPVFELRLPSASLANWAAYVDQLNKRGIPTAAVVTKLKFDTQSDYPKLIFEASGWANEEQARVVLEVINTEEVDQCTGKNDKAVDANTVKAIAAPAVAAQNQAAASSVPPLNLNQGLPPAAPVAMPPTPAPAPAAALPPFPPAASASAMPPLPPMGAAPAAASAPAPAKRTRGSKKAAETVAAPMADAPPDFLNRQPAAPAAAPSVNAAAVAAPLAAPVTNSALDDMINQAMKA